MPDYIERNALYEKTAKWESLALQRVEQSVRDGDLTEWRKWSAVLTERSAFKFDVADAPAADVQPVVHGKWIDKKKKTYGMQTFCSTCGKHSGIGGIESNRHKPYCPNCGARMDLVVG